MPPNLSNLQRTYYFQGELLQLADFVREQQYVRDLVRYQNTCVFAPGVVQGLALSGQGSTTLTAGAGLAFDGNGVPLVVAQDTSLDLSTAALPAGSYYASLAYADNSANNTANLRTTHTIIEQPQLQKPAANAPAAPVVILGMITVDASGRITAIDQSSASKRQLSAVLLPQQSGGQLQAAAVPAPSAADVSAASVSKAAVSAPGTSGPLRIGEPVSDGQAMLSVGQDLSGQPAGTSTARFDFVDGSTQGSGVSINVKKADGSHALISARYAGNEVWTLGQDGTPQTLSDASLKVDVRPLSGALERIAALRPVSFAWKDSAQRHLGFLAQEVAEVMPELVGTNAQGHRTLAYQELVPLLMQAVQELTARVKELELKLGGANAS